jgi:arylsulfatase A-like enzyme
MGHGNTLYREEIQVPLMFYFPGGEISKRISSNVSTIDILPTLRELIGQQEDDGIEGLSLLDYVDDKQIPQDERYLYSYLWRKKIRSKGDKPKINEVEYRSTLYKAWHFIMRMPNSTRLFHLEDDKTEQNNVRMKKKKQARMLLGKFNDFLKNCKKYRQKTAKYKFNKKEMERLKTLGYVQ